MYASLIEKAGRASTTKVEVQRKIVTAFTLGGFRDQLARCAAWGPSIR
jgi:hypothetical protein